MSDDTMVDEATAEETADQQPAPEATEAEAGDNSEQVPADEAAGGPDDGGQPEAEPVATDESAPADEPAEDPSGDRAVARVFLTETGYRVISLWSDPENVPLRAGRHGDMVAHQLYPVGDLPEKVQRALNPLKASKKSS